MRISDLAESIGIRPKPYRILTLDGGGVRGIIPVLWLERLSHLRSFALHWRPFAAYSPRS
jgi:hypothetical protein